MLELAFGGLGVEDVAGARGDAPTGALEAVKPDPAMNKFTASEIFVRTFGFVFGELRTFFVIAAVPYLLTVLLRIAIRELAQDLPEESLIYAGVLADIALFLVAVPFMTAWHRWTLIGAALDAAAYRYNFRPAEFRFTGYSAILLGITILMALPLAAIAAALSAGAAGLGYLLLLPGLVAMIYVIGRIGLILPAAAVGRSMSIAESWKLSRGNGGGILLAFLMVGFVLVLVSLLIMLTLAAMLIGDGGAAGTDGGPAGAPATVRHVSFGTNLVVTIVGEAIRFFVTAVLVSTQAFVFQSLTDFSPDDAGQI